MIGMGGERRARLKPLHRTKAEGRRAGRARLKPLHGTKHGDGRKVGWAGSGAAVGWW